MIHQFASALSPYVPINVNDQGFPPTPRYIKCQNCPWV